MESEKILGFKVDVIARLGCFKPIYLVREYISRGDLEKAKKILEELTEDLKRYSKDLAEMAQHISRSRNISRMSPEEAVKTLEGILSMMKNKIFSSPQGVRLCIYIQPHLEVMYSNLSIMKEDLARSYRDPSGLSIATALKDLEAYLVYISKYINDLLGSLNKL